MKPLTHRKDKTNRKSEGAERIHSRERDEYEYPMFSQASDFLPSDARKADGYRALKSRKT